MYDKKRNHKKIKKRRSFRAVFLTALICAAVSVLVIVGALWFVGLRYVSLNTADGTKIKFFGMREPYTVSSVFFFISTPFEAVPTDYSSLILQNRI